MITVCKFWGEQSVEDINNLDNERNNVENINNNNHVENNNDNNNPEYVYQASLYNQANVSDIDYDNDSIITELSSQSHFIPFLPNVVIRREY